MIALLRTRRGSTADPVRAGVREVAPIIVGVVPFGVTIGVAIVESPIGNFAGWLGGPLIAAGSAHLAAITLDGAGASALAVVLTATIVNARLAAYSAALVPVFGAQPLWFRWLGPSMLVDQTFALIMARQDAEPGWLRTYYLSAVAALWTAWVGAISLGMAAGPVIPGSWDLWLAMPLMFCGMAVPAAQDRPSIAAAAAAAIVSLQLSDLPAGLGLVAGIGAGAVAGAIWSRADRG